MRTIIVVCLVLIALLSLNLVWLHNDRTAGNEKQEHAFFSHLKKGLSYNLLNEEAYNSIIHYDSLQQYFQIRNTSLKALETTENRRYFYMLMHLLYSHYPSLDSIVINDKVINKSDLYYCLFLHLCSNCDVGAKVDVSCVDNRNHLDSIQYSISNCLGSDSSIMPIKLEVCLWTSDLCEQIIVDSTGNDSCLYIAREMLAAKWFQDFGIDSLQHIYELEKNHFLYAFSESIKKNELSTHSSKPIMSRATVNLPFSSEVSRTRPSLSLASIPSKPNTNASPPPTSSTSVKRPYILRREKIKKKIKYKNRKLPKPPFSAPKLSDSPKRLSKETTLEYLERQYQLTDYNTRVLKFRFNHIEEILAKNVIKKISNHLTFSKEFDLVIERKGEFDASIRIYTEEMCTNEMFSLNKFLQLIKDTKLGIDTYRRLSGAGNTKNPLHASADLILGKPDKHEKKSITIKELNESPLSYSEAMNYIDQQLKNELKKFSKSYFYGLKSNHKKIKSNSNVPVFNLILNIELKEIFVHEIHKIEEKEKKLKEIAKYIDEEKKKK
ncbi:MAG: hypothetical protein MI974_13275 [Chitinophagales bacterium]|nr:hypothetical protein [Chitinophagales bacterium]